MKTTKFFKLALLAAALAAAGVAGSIGSASAFVACNRVGDCWHTDTRVRFPGVRLTFHPDKWWDQHKADKHLTWHDADGDHDWHHGYWSRGTWHSA